MDDSYGSTHGSSKPLAASAGQCVAEKPTGIHDEISGSLVPQFEAAALAPWCKSASKRIFDLFFACMLLACASPLMLVAAILIKAGSRGPMLFRHTRVGQGGREFQLMKFRTMEHSPHPAGGNLTTKGDARVTAIGRLLRKWKVDELPQLLNVLRGDMSIVGPRPDVSEFMVTLSPGLQAVLALKPGLTSPASIRFRNEEEVLARVPPQQVTRYYVQVVLPQKARIDLNYAQRADMLSDVKIIASTFAAIVR